MDKDTIALDLHLSPSSCSHAIERMTSYFYEKNPDISSLTAPLFDLVGADKEDTFVFTSSGGEAIGQVIWSVFLNECQKKGKTELICSPISSSETVEGLKQYEQFGCMIKLVSVDLAGQIDIEELANLITSKTALISVPIAQGLTGVIQPIAPICELAKKKNVLVHLDASYAIGKIDLSFSQGQWDYLTFSGEYIHSIKGSGALFAKKETPLQTMIFKGVNEKIDVPSLAGLSGAAHLALLSMDSMGLEVARLRDLFETEVEKTIPDAAVLFRKSVRLPNTTVISFARIHTDSLNYILRRKGLQTNHSESLSPILYATSAANNLDGDSAISFSLSRMNTESDMLQAVSMLHESVKFLRAVSEDLF